MTLMAMGVRPPARRVLVRLMSLVTPVTIVVLEEVVVEVETGTKVTLFQFGCLATH